jgi:mannosyltransferase
VETAARFGAKSVVSWPYVLGLLTLAAAGLRALGLNSQLWCDEIITVVNSVRIPTRTLLTSYFYDNQHTLFSLLAQGSVAIFGEHPWSIRLPAMLLGTASVPGLYFLGRELTSRFEALSAAGLLAVSYHHIWFSQNARGYTALMLAAVLATWCFVRGIRGTNRWPWLLYAIVVALGMYTHLTMLFIAISHALICLWLVARPNTAKVRLTSWKRPAVGFLLAAALTLLLYAPMLQDVQNFFMHKPTGMRAVSTPGWALAEAWVVLQKGLGGLSLIAIPVLLGAALITGCGVLSYWRQDRVALMLYVLPVIVTIGGALAARGTMYPRFFFYLAGFGLLLAVRGIAVFGESLTALLARGSVPRFPNLVGASLVTILIACSGVSLGATYRYPKQDFQGPMRFIEAQRSEGESVVTAGVSANFCYHCYYDPGWGKVQNVSDLSLLPSRSISKWKIQVWRRLFANSLSWHKNSMARLTAGSS